MKLRRLTDAAETPRSSERGFTLVELLIAIAIFITVMAGVTLLFTNAVRLSKQGFQNQEAFEISRGLMATIEQDLSRVYINRDTGATSTFYGSPYGMTFIMKMNADDLSSPDLARVTYVFHRSAGKKNLLSLPDPDNEAQLDSERRRPTYALIRYLEPGVEDLDSFPVDWDFAQTDSQNPISLQTYIDGRRNNFMNALEAQWIPPGFESDAHVDEELDRALKREIWLRMLAGGDPGNSDIPDAWGTLAAFRDSGNAIILVPEDFILAENVLQLDGNGDPISDTDTLLPSIEEFHKADILGPDDPNYIPPVLFMASPHSAFFSYRELARTTKQDVSFIDGIYPGARPIDTNPASSNFLRENLDPNAVLLTEFIGRDLVYWNDIRNVEYQFRQTRAAITDFAILGDPRSYVRTGSPLDPRLPEAVNVRFTLFFQTPYPGAPDFFETFTQRIELPTGYRRPNDI